MDQRADTIDAGEAEAIAVAGLAFVAGDDRLMTRFLALSGITADQIREAAREPGFLAGVMQFIVAHEPTLVAFAEHADIAPKRVALAARRLPGADDTWDVQT